MNTATPKSRDFICDYGNCGERMEAGKSFQVTVTVTRHGHREEMRRFCCYEHAHLWNKMMDERHYGGARPLTEVGR